MKKFSSPASGISRFVDESFRGRRSPMVESNQMVDRLRAYRRWRSRRLALLVPVFLAALGTQLWLAAGSAAPAWLRVASLGASSLILALVGYFVAQTLFCSL